MSDSRWYNSDVFDKIIEEDKAEHNQIEGMRLYSLDYMDNGIKDRFIKKEVA